jgi:ankyrin repeat protein
MSPIQLLIHAGANLAAKNASGMTPLIYAMQKGESNQENIKALVCYSKQEEINEVDDEDRTALHHLAKMNTANKVFLTYLTKVLLVDKKKEKSKNINIIF